MSGSTLKLIACIVMLIDHMAAFLPGDFIGMKETLFMIGDKAITLRMLMHYIGRTAFPIFAFLITEGFIHTKNRKRYAINLIIFALLSEIPWNLAHTGDLFYSRQNVFFTLLSGYLGICAYEHYRGNVRNQSIALLILLISSIIIRADYGAFGFGFILFLYLFRERKALMGIIGSCILPSRWIGGMAFIPILMYNGKRGFAKAKWTKYVFYIFYPLHLMILYLVRTYVLL